MTKTPEIFSATIIAVGAFNPAIFTPDWLDYKGLIGHEDAEVARQSGALIVSQQFSVIDTEWFTLQVVENQMTLASKGVVTPTLRDLAVGIFTLLSQTPVTALGMNFAAHYKMANADDYHKIGDVLAPKAVWNSAYSLDAQSVGMTTVAVRVQQGVRSVGSAASNDHKNITVQPSTKLMNGIFFLMNDHRDISSASDADGLTAAERVVNVLTADWQSTWDDSLRVFDSVLTAALSA